MPPPQGAMYARVASDQQAEAQTIASQVAALRERRAAEGLTVPDALQCLAEGDSGAPWAWCTVRPAAPCGGLGGHASNRHTAGLVSRQGLRMREKVIHYPTEVPLTLSCGSCYNSACGMAQCCAPGYNAPLQRSR